MPRHARIVAPGVAHHITQRGTDRQKVFYSHPDRGVYLDLLRLHSRETGVRVLSYCLMTNHVHLVCVPDEQDSLAVCLRRTHGRYAQYLNARRQRTGHLWQNRFYSCALDERHLWLALRYVELNPVRAGLVEVVEGYRYSSALAHLTGYDLFRLLDMEFWAANGGAEAWAGLLQRDLDERERKLLRRATHAGTPLGSAEFVEQWGRPTQVPLAMTA